ncbi:hypothetical protein [Tenacibaculum sp. IB213877]|uniref:hypothetical protein n=1 Tax=Tenacibaculum sp. IB213877 TaxID=3097351 RepID=UPI002A5AC9E9|nr:hypothetical protein [Tenacibaculum sp. IB213877]MDY0780294.1 hypothetical protein [Tenacibaculum sp. IB213877]
METKVIKGTHFAYVSSSTSADTKKVLEIASHRPLAPTNVSAIANGIGNETKIKLMCTIYVCDLHIPKNDNGENDYTKDIQFNISYLVDNESKVTIYVARDDKYVSSKTFYAYVVPIHFSPKDIPGLNNNFTTVEVINWDEDPEGSRGTETTVKQGAGEK